MLIEITAWLFELSSIILAFMQMCHLRLLVPFYVGLVDFRSVDLGWTAELASMPNRDSDTHVLDIIAWHVHNNIEYLIIYFLSWINEVVFKNYRYRSS